MSVIATKNYLFSDRFAMATSTSQSCTALDKLAVAEEGFVPRSVLPPPVRYRSFRTRYRTSAESLNGCWRRLFCIRCGSCLQKVILFMVLLTTCATWSGLFNHRQPLGRMWPGRWRYKLLHSVYSLPGIALQVFSFSLL